jgi:hypothetical protein
MLFTPLFPPVASLSLFPFNTINPARHPWEVSVTSVTMLCEPSSQAHPVYAAPLKTHCNKCNKCNIGLDVHLSNNRSWKSTVTMQQLPPHPSPEGCSQLLQFPNKLQQTATNSPPRKPLSKFGMHHVGP